MPNCSDQWAAEATPFNQPKRKGKKGEGRGTSRTHGRVRRYSGVRNPGSVTQPVSTKEVQRRSRKAKRGMGEAVDPTYTV